MFKDLKSLLVEARTCRRFQASHDISYDVLEDLVDMARITPCARNAQVLRYAIIRDAAVCQEMVATYALGGSLQSEDRPQTQQVPTAYIVILAPHDLSEWSIMDIGIAAQTIQLGATEKGLSACMVGAFNSPKVLDILKAQGLDVCDKLFSVLRNQEDTETILKARLLIVLGKADEERVLGDIPADGKTTYFRENNKHVVPKRALDDIILLKK